MATILELTADIVTAHASNNLMTTEEVLAELQKVHAALKALEAGETLPTEASQQKQFTIKQAFKKDEVICMICGKGFKTLKRHLAQAHELKPGQYRKQFNIPASTPLVAKNYSEARRQAANDRGLGDALVKARATRAANAAAKKAKAPAAPKAAKAKKK